ncbi:hypothetical protein D3C80_1781530 [compost metagenome]
MLDTVAGNPLEHNLFVKGGLNEWGVKPEHQLSYKGMDGDLAIYQVVFNYSGTTEFKLADEDWKFEYLYNGGGAIEPEVGYAFAYAKPGSGAKNNSLTLPQGYWSFLVKVDPTGAKPGTGIVQECTPK